MHIAVLDDDVASRKQMERLLERASDANKKNGLEGYYIDSYGDYEPLHKRIAMYDGIFIDMVDSDMKGHEIAESIFESGIQGKIILCISTINYREIISSEYADHFLFIDKPIKTSDLEDTLKVCEEKRLDREPQIEIRTKDETLYVKYNEFIYAKALVAGKTTIVLAGRGDTIYYKDITMVKKSITEYPFMIAVNKDTIISTYHVDKVNTFSVIMDDGTSFPISLKMSSTLKKILAKKASI
ncbi:MAG: LytTR family transcriptional regulator DNA-binding domain-containing protein [Lachnospiraceae bacterium]|nr:LytTR family transcriptional regulator DNA-binding domain-containing protein [Lachnospiraceae bacterium]